MSRRRRAVIACAPRVGEVATLALGEGTVFVGGAELGHESGEGELVAFLR